MVTKRGLRQQQPVVTIIHHHGWRSGTDVILTIQSALGQAHPALKPCLESRGEVVPGTVLLAETAEDLDDPQVRAAQLVQLVEEWPDLDAGIRARIMSMLGQ